MTEQDATRRVAVRSVAVPSEHGGWSLTLEPALLGLLVSPSWAGLTLMCVALVGFLLRTPLKLSLGDRRRGRKLERTDLADRVVSVYMVLLIGLLLVAEWLGDSRFWLPLLMALPLFIIELAYDVQARSRRLVPEMVGTVGVGAIAAAIVLADGGAVSLAYGLWMIAGARAVAAIPFVRTQLRRAKAQPHRLIDSDGAQALAVAIAVLAVASTTVPLPAALAIIGLAVFHLWGVRSNVPRVAIIGAQQMVLGLTVVLITALSAIAP